MVEINVVYEGDLHCRLTHGPSGAEIFTDAPKDNHGKGEAFSPTDLVAAAIGSCMLTVMGIFAKRHQINLAGTRLRVQKEMIQEPARRIGQLKIEIQFPKTIPEECRRTLENTAMTCPVHKSLHPDVKIPVTFEYVL